MKRINIDNLVCPHIKKMQAYSSARLEYEGKDAIFLDANENSLGSVTSSIHNRYPDPLQQDVKANLAQIENINTNQIFLGNGSDECIDVLIRCFCNSGQDEILIFPPVFSMYEHAAHVQHIGVREILLLSNNFQLDRAKILTEIESNQNLKIIFICTPNNPTGNQIEKNDILEILNNFNGLVVIDEAYQDFSDKKSWTSQLENFENLVVIKTFSKAWGMADARLGMLYAHPTIITYLNVIKMPYNVNQNTQKLALEALQNIDKKDNYIKILNAYRQYLLEEMEKISAIKKTYTTDANFILFKVDDANALYKYLIDKGIVIRNRDKAPLLKGCLRVSVGTEVENQKFIDALKKYH
jgi:histidinol-phosphate aminotransferase